ncbi:hypothetical protein GCM10027203_74860 [Nonomuraea fastidiosa]
MPKKAVMGTIDTGRDLRTLSSAWPAPTSLLYVRRSGRRDRYRPPQEPATVTFSNEVCVEA